MLGRLAEIRRVHLVHAIAILGVEDELAVFRPEQIADSVVALEYLLGAPRRERRFPHEEMIAACATSAAAPTLLRLVGRAVRLRAARGLLELEVVEAFAVRQPAEAPLHRVGRSQAGVRIVAEGVVAIAQLTLRELRHDFAIRVPDRVDRPEVLILDEVRERLLHRRDAEEPA